MDRERAAGEAAPAVGVVSASAVLGVDPSLTATSRCLVIDGVPYLRVTCTEPKTGKDDEKLERMRFQVDEIVEWSVKAHVVVIEGLSHASRGSATRDLAGLWWMMMDRLRHHDVCVAVCAPQTRAKWATGKGNAPKFVVGQHIGKRWPDIELRDDNEADSLALASMALHLTGQLPWQPTKPQTEALEALSWPFGRLA